MNMKRITPLALSALLLGTVSAGAASPPKPNDVTTTEATTEVNEAASFMQVQGTIGVIENRKDQTFYSVTDQNNPF
ncbi:MAG: hypothetical protein RR588_15250, partial [Solibacillus sp.]